MDTPSLFVKKDEPLTLELWNRMGQAVRANRVIFGNGVRGRQTPDGTLLSCSFSAACPHPFRVSLLGNAAKVSCGFINDDIEPTICDATTGKEVPIGGTEELPQPELSLAKPKFDDDGNGWILVEITVDPEDNYKATGAEVLQDSTLKTKDPLKTRKALALLARRKEGNPELFQIEFFNLKHICWQGSIGALRHFVYV